MITISGKALGRKRPLFADWSVPMPPRWEGGGAATLRDLIDQIVRGEAAAFKQRQHDRRFLHALTAQQIEEGAEAGKIAMGGAEFEPQNVDEDEAVDSALQAFEDGIYLVVVDGEQHRQLDAQVFLGEESQITFVRLTLLAGG